MADKRQVKKTIKQLQRISTWQLLVLLLLMGFVAATFLRLNNIGMSERREAVLAIDKADDSFALQNRLFDLQRYVAAHMNTSTGAFYLEGQYKRDSQKVVDAAKESGDPGQNVYAKAESVCRPQYSSWSPAYMQCFQDELAKYPASSDPAMSVTLPSTSIYRHSFASSAWTPDFAGWSILACAVIVLMIITRLISLFVLRTLLRHHYKSI